MISQEELQGLLSYDADTGAFAWRKSGKGRNSGEAGAIGGNGYRQITIGGRKYQAHRLAVLYMQGEWPTADVDHIDGNRTNNSASNLRCVSRSLNMQNQHKLQERNKSGVRGVAWIASAGKWCARIAGQHIGLFDSIEAAAAARKCAEKANFIKPQSGFA